MARTLPFGRLVAAMATLAVAAILLLGGLLSNAHRVETATSSNKPFSICVGSILPGFCITL